MNNIYSLIENSGVLPVINLSDPTKAIDLVDSFARANIKAIEVTLRSEKSINSIEIIRKERPDFIVGAGTILNLDICKKAIAKGAQFIVSPGFDEEILGYCNSINIPYFPGCSTATEVQKAVKLGVKVIKFFPADICGGADVIKAFSGPFPDVKWLPTCGINLKNLADYVKLPQVLACGGSFMAPADMIKNNDFGAIEALAKEAYKISLGFELAHVGINEKNADDAKKVTFRICDAFMFQFIECSNSYFSGTVAEICKEPFPGTMGHVGIRTNNMNRAMAYLKAKGFDFDEKNIKTDDKGIYVAYLKEEIGGFAFHLVRR